MNTYDPRQDDPMNDDYNMTQEQFEEAASAMNFPTVTIPDPAAVGRWLDEHQPGNLNARPTYGVHGWYECRWTGKEHIVAGGDTPEALLADLRAKLAEHDPLAKLRKEAEAAGYALIKLPID